MRLRLFAAIFEPIVHKLARLYRLPVPWIPARSFGTQRASRLLRRRRRRRRFSSLTLSLLFHCCTIVAQTPEYTLTTEWPLSIFSPRDSFLNLCFTLEDNDHYHFMTDFNKFIITSAKPLRRQITEEKRRSSGY